MVSEGDTVPDLTLVDHTGETVRLSDLTEPGPVLELLGFDAPRPLILVFYRGDFCPRDRRQLARLVPFWPETRLSEVGLAAVSVQRRERGAALRDELGARFPFLADPDREAVEALDIVDDSEPEHPRVAAPHTLVLDGDRVVRSLYDGWWFAGRPTIEELRRDVRDVLSGRPEWDRKAWSDAAVQRVRVPATRWEDGPTPIDKLPHRGVVARFDEDEGIGWIDTDDGEVAFHFSAIPGRGAREIAPGTEVAYRIVEGPAGEAAGEVRPLPDA